MPSPSAEVVAAARQALAYLSATDPLPGTPCDAIMGFGVFDLRLPVFCGQLYRRGLAPKIIFSGGTGAGTGNLGRPEADAWHAALLRADANVPPADVILENRSTNTAENIAFTSDLLAQQHPELAFSRGIRRLIVVASPSRLRRVGLTLRQTQPTLEIVRQVPPVTLEAEWAIYGLQGINYLEHLVGELDRLVTYPARGWIAAEPLPREISEIHSRLRLALGRDSA